jgi:hypothetical protein
MRDVVAFVMKLGNVEVEVTCPVKKFEFFDITIEKLIN